MRRGFALHSSRFVRRSIPLAADKQPHPPPTPPIANTLFEDEFGELVDGVRSDVRKESKSPQVISSEVREVFAHKIFPFLPPPGTAIALGDFGNSLPLWRAAKDTLPPGYSLSRVINLFPEKVRLFPAPTAIDTGRKVLLIERVAESVPNGEEVVSVAQTSFSDLTDDARKKLLETLAKYRTGITLRILGSRIHWRDWEFGPLLLVLLKLGVRVSYFPPDHTVVVLKEYACNPHEAPVGVPLYTMARSALHRDGTNSLCQGRQVPLDGLQSFEMDDKDIDSADGKDRAPSDVPPVEVGRAERDLADLVESAALTLSQDLRSVLAAIRPLLRKRRNRAVESSLGKYRTAVT
jgi:hypothetical protein